jgi:hypothetical protein
MHVGSTIGVGPLLSAGLAGQPFQGSGSTHEPALPQEDRRVTAPFGFFVLTTSTNFFFMHGVLNEIYL